MDLINVPLADDKVQGRYCRQVLTFMPGVAEAETRLRADVMAIRDLCADTCQRGTAAQSLWAEASRVASIAAFASLPVSRLMVLVLGLQGFVKSAAMIDAALSDG